MHCVLIIEIPTIVAAGDKDLWEGLKVTIFFSLGTVPIQLTIALFLSVLLFQKMRGSEVFRVIYFLPYVTPAIATATVFRVIFSDRPWIDWDAALHRSAGSRRSTAAREPGQALQPADPPQSPPLRGDGFRAHTDPVARG